MLTEPSIKIISAAYIIPRTFITLQNVHEPHANILPLDLPAQAGDPAIYSDYIFYQYSFVEALLVTKPALANFATLSRSGTIVPNFLDKSSLLSF